MAADHKENQTTEPLEEVAPGSLIAGRYRILRELDRGGWSVVYLAQDCDLIERSVAVKVLSVEKVSQTRQDDRWIQRQFFMEMEALSRINHPNVVDVLDYGRTPGGKLFMVLQYINGVKLREIIDREGMNLKHVAYIVRQIGRALSAAHEKGILHCDLKPENIMLQDLGDPREMVKLIDFGVAKVSDSQVATSMVSRDFSGLGTWPYNAPEQLSQGELGEWTDIYSFGVITYEMVTGRRPYVTNNPVALAAAQRDIKVKPKDLRPDLSEKAQAAILKALAYDPAERDRHYQFAHEFGEELANSLDGRQRARPVGGQGAGSVSAGQGASDGDKTISGGHSTLDEAHVLYLGLVEETEAAIEGQVEIIRRLDEIVRQTPTFRQAHQANALTVRLVGNELALIFSRSPAEPAQCALEVARAVSNPAGLPNVGLRIGAHSGPVFLVNKQDPVGGGVNIARQLMICGDAGHILLSKAAADNLLRLGGWAESLRDLGQRDIGAGAHLHFFNLCRDGIGNPETPRQFREFGDGGERLHEILAIRIGVSLQSQADLNGKSLSRELLIYRPDRIGNGLPDPVERQITLHTLQRQLDDVHKEVKYLLERAERGQQRDGDDLDEMAYAFSQIVLPEGGLSQLVGQVAHPQFDPDRGVPGAIPVELLQERYYACPIGHRLPVYQPFCGQDGQPVDPEMRHSMLVLDYYITSAARGVFAANQWGRGLADGQRKCFLFIEDPGGNLCQGPKDFCSTHLDDLRLLMEQCNYEVVRLWGPNAKLRPVLEALKDPQVVGIYFFGHGYFDARSGESGLMLSGSGQGSPLMSGEIERAAPNAKLVFLNACAAAASSGGWEDGPRSVAHAFAQGQLDRVVIAPIWPVIASQAAETALKFFKQALQGVMLAEALKRAREESYWKYKDGQAHLAWFSYRYFGDPNLRLPIIGAEQTAETQETHTCAETGADDGRATTDATGAKESGKEAREEARKETGKEKAQIRVFNVTGRFVKKVFAFNVDEVMLRAVKRRNLQQRAQVTVTDFLAGLIRRGDLTRFVLTERQIEPDTLYDKICQESEASTEPLVNEADLFSADMAPDTAHLDLCRLSKEELEKLLARWVVRDQKDFSPELICALERADLIAQQVEDLLITERDFIEGLIMDGSWAALEHLGLPPAGEVRSLMLRLEELELDGNGWVLLGPWLDANVKKVIRTAQQLSQQRRQYPIPAKLLLAALLENPNGFAAQACRHAGVDPKLLYDLMVGLAEEKKEKKDTQIGSSFGLTPEACRRSVLPVLKVARRVAAAESRVVNERDILIALCDLISPEFRDWLKRPFESREWETLEVDLDELKLTDPHKSALLQRLTRRARKVVETAHALSQKLGVFPISHHLLLAAFLARSNGYVVEVCMRRRVSSRELGKYLIAMAERAGASAREFTLTPESCAGAVNAMLEQARSAGDGLITEPALFRAFCAAASPQFKQDLEQKGVDLDALSADPDPPDDDSSPPSGGVNSQPLPSQQFEDRAPPGPDATTRDISSSLSSHHSAPTVVIRPDRFSEGAWRVLLNAERLARGQGWPEVMSPHLFAAMIGDGETPMARFLQRNHFSYKKVRQAALMMTASPSTQQTGRPMAAAGSESGVPRFGRNALKVVGRAAQKAAAEDRLVAEQDLCEELLAAGGSIGMLLREFAAAQGANTEISNKEGRVEVKSVLATFGVDLTEKARRGELPVIVGREREIETAMHTLLLTENACPLLVGDAGVGKTAIVEGLAQRIARRECPERLQTMRVIELSVGGLVANTRLRGEFEQRVRDLLDEARGDVVLFIDEIHTIVGVGAAEGVGPDAGDMLKAALARGEIRLIGATTHAEYKRTIARDKALSRRFQAQIISPPSREATIQALAARQEALEAHHAVRITKAARVAAVDLSGRYIVDKQWPAKARDTLERACVFALTKRARNQAAGRVKVTAEHVAEVVARQTGLPVDRVSTSGLSALDSLEERICRRIIGQPEAIRAVADAIRRGRKGLADKDRPWGAFLFVGAPGVGKTELAKVLADEVYGGAGATDGLIRFDMGDFTEPHSVSKLTGAPPGYVGFDQGAPLVEQLRTRPYSLILFDEIEQAHENVLAALLRLLSEGTLTDSEGNLADARNAIVILTSNLLGAEQKLRRPGFASEERAATTTQTGLRSSMERHLPSKLIDRLDAIIRFNPLTAEDLAAIATQKLNILINSVSALYGVSVAMDVAAAPLVAAWAMREGAGARAIQRAIDREIAAPISEFLNQAQKSGHKRIRVRIDNGAVVVEAADTIQ
jgi:ATP-dependent Clp protease ATP-binding subunit ClpC